MDQFAYPLNERNEKKNIEEINKSRPSLVSILASKIEENNKKAKNDLDSSIDLESEENSVFNFGNKSNANPRVQNIILKSNNKIKEEKKYEEDNEEDLFEKQNDEKNKNDNSFDITNDIDENQEDSDDNDDSYNNQNNNAIILPYNNRYNNRRRNNIYGRLNNNPFIYNNRFNNNNFNNNNNNINKSEFNTCPSFNTNFFGGDKKGIKLFRVCIKHNFQGLTHLFITRGYGLMKAVEDAFYESKFNLSMKLLIRSPNNETYQSLNNEKQNLFHILGHIKNINSQELPKFLEILYSKQIPLDSQDIYGNTPLHYAAINNFEEFIKFIVDKFKNNKYILDIKNKENYIPLFLAMKGDNINHINKNIFDLLFTIKDINQLNPEDESLIEYSSTSKDMQEKNQDYKCSLLLYVVRKLLKLPSQKNSQYTNLKYFYKKLIQTGASIIEKDTHGRTCLNYAVLENNLPFLKMLCTDAGYNINKSMVDNKGKSLVHYCVSLNEFGSYENQDMLNYLYDNNFISNSKDFSNKTPLDYALEQKSKKNLTILKRRGIEGS